MLLFNLLKLALVVLSTIPVIKHVFKKVEAILLTKINLASVQNMVPLTFLILEN